MVSLRYGIVSIEIYCLMGLSLDVSLISRHLCLFLAENMLQLLCETWIMMCCFSQTRSSFLYIYADMRLFLFSNYSIQHFPQTTNQHVCCKHLDLSHTHLR
jgi:hypothetical protein